MPFRIAISLATLLALPTVITPAAADDGSLYGEENLIYVIEVFDKVNKDQTFRQSCECVQITSLEEEASNKYPSPQFKVFKVKTAWFNETGKKAFDSIHYLAHEVGTDNSTWYVHHLKFGMKPIAVP